VALGSQTRGSLMAADTHPYVTAEPYLGLVPQWMHDDDAKRVEAYRLYQAMYWTEPRGLRIKRPDGEQAVQLPDPRTVVNTTAHYFCKGLTVGPGALAPGSAEAVALGAFLARERFLSKFMVAKRQGVAFGDFLLHLTADPDAPAGARISINSVDPGEFFPVWDDDDLDRKVAVHLARQELVNEGDPRRERVMIRRKTYRYVRPGRGLNRQVWVEEGLYDPETWFKTGGRPTREIMAPARLPDAVQTIPVYHFRNQPWRGDPFGSSELRGFEGLMQAADQTMTDEQVALRLEGGGVFVTDAAPPVDEQGEEEDWEVAPGKVLQVGEGRRFDRVQGVQSVQPFLDHVGKLQAGLWEASGTPEIARGKVDVSAVESGIALAIQFSPVLAKIEDREAEAMDVLANLWHDWAGWMAEFEQTAFTVPPVCALGEKLPLNRDAMLRSWLTLLEARVVSREWVRAQARDRFGWDIPASMEAEVLAESEAMASAFELPGNSRADQEAADQDAEGDDDNATF
jgi:hypothetical protein